MAATVLQLSDTHLTAERGGPVHGVDPDARLDAVLAAWTATGASADLVLLTGDLSDDGSREACSRLAAALRPLGAPVVAVPGNHDDPEVVSQVFGGAEAAEVDGWRIVLVDSTTPGESHGTIDVAAEMARLDALDGRPTVLALHHAPASQSTNPYFRLDGAAELLDGLRERTQVRAVVAGHLHDGAALSTRGGLPVLGCPSTLISITHSGSDMELHSEAPTGARVLHLETDGRLRSEIVAA